MTGPGLTALVVDDELPALSELSWLLGQDERIGEVFTASSGTEALGVLDAREVDVVFSDISMPGLDGMALARVIAKFSTQPQVVFVTAHDEHAVDAFTLAATDYVMKPVGKDRLREAVRRVLTRAEEGEALASGAASAPPPPDETIPVELGGVTRFVSRSQIRFAQAHGDYARLHTDTGSHLVRIPLTALEEQWGEHGFVRIHRSTLVALAHIDEVRMDHGRCTLLIGGALLQVSRRHTRALREVLLRRPIGRPSKAP